ncbi:MAG: SCO1664 family protein [Anaerolineales bacterium]|nr:SCO1664 family protein [Anaerolineales bacterium]
MPADSLKNILQFGELELKGQFMLGSNYTFLVTVRHEGREYQGVYKPSKGEQPLWDFPDNTLAHREVAAYLVSEALGWHFVPYTTLRDDGPYGPGSIQQYIEYDPNYHYFNFTDEDKARLQPVMLFDLLCNNADRKGSHVIIEEETNKMWLIDHGLCFHEDDKLRTVIWDYAGELISDDLLEVLAQLPSDQKLQTDLQAHLSPREISALIMRAKVLVSSGVFPLPPEHRRAFPYPPL